MKSYREELWFETKTRRAYVNITPQVDAVVQKSGVREGMVLVNAMHITASVYINDDEAGLLRDYDDFLERLAPHEATYRHNDTGEDNGDAHIKRQLMGREWWSPLRMGSWTSGRGNKYFTESSMGGGVSVCWSRSSENDASNVLWRGCHGWCAAEVDEEPHSRLPRSGKFGNMDNSMNRYHSAGLRIDMGGQPC
jgi:secondary thiamine-phosphate synthase enzyme